MTSSLQGHPQLALEWPHSHSSSAGYTSQLVESPLLFSQKFTRSQSPFETVQDTTTNATAQPPYLTGPIDDPRSDRHRSVDDPPEDLMVSAADRPDLPSPLSAFTSQSPPARAPWSPGLLTHNDRHPTPHATQRVGAASIPEEPQPAAGGLQIDDEGARSSYTSSQSPAVLNDDLVRDPAVVRLVWKLRLPEAALYRPDYIASIALAAVEALCKHEQTIEDLDSTNTSLECRVLRLYAELERRESELVKLERDLADLRRDHERDVRIRNDLMSVVLQQRS